MICRLTSVLVALCSIALPLGASANTVDSTSVDRWDFDVYLDDKKVGAHTFLVEDNDGVRSVQSKADFKVTILLIPAYRYEHSSNENWRGGCLQDISAFTNANGKRSQVSGYRGDLGFELSVGVLQVDLPPCVMTFAYWNPNFLDQPRLLNPQTGEYLDVAIVKDGREQLTVRGESIAAQRYTVKAKEVDVTLWYSDTKQWLALESVAQGGRVIRYELS